MSALKACCGSLALPMRERYACVFTSAAVSGTNTTLDCSRTNGIDQTYHPITNRAGRSLIASKARNGFLKEKEICQAKGSPCRHLERRFPVSRLERCPACHPERELWIWRDGRTDPKLALRMTCIISKCLLPFHLSPSLCRILP